MSVKTQFKKERKKNTDIYFLNYLPQLKTHFSGKINRFLLTQLYILRIKYVL